MINDQLDWKIGGSKYSIHYDEFRREVSISGVIHDMSEDSAGLAHCILLLIDSINDSKIGNPS